MLVLEYWIVYTVHVHLARCRLSSSLLIHVVLLTYYPAPVCGGFSRCAMDSCSRILNPFPEAASSYGKGYDRRLSEEFSSPGLNRLWKKNSTNYLFRTIQNYFEDSKKPALQYLCVLSFQQWIRSNQAHIILCSSEASRLKKSFPACWSVDVRYLIDGGTSCRCN